MINFRVLVVEDDAFALEIMKELLKNYFDEILTASDGLEALEIIKKENIDIIFSDINMPNMDGIELFEKIREKNKTKSFVLMTAFDDMDLIIKGIEVGIDAYIFKPVDAGLLENVVNKVKKSQQERKEFEKYTKLLHSYQEAVDKTSIISKTDKKGVITYVNDEFCRVSKFSREELIGKPHNIVRHPEMPKEVFKEMWQTILSKKPWQGIIKNRAKDASSYYIKSFIMPILDENGEIEEFIAIRADVTSIMSSKNILFDKIKENPDKTLVLILLDKYEITESFFSDEILFKLNESVKSFLENKFNEKVFAFNNGEYGFLTEKDIKTLKNIQKKINEEFIKVEGYSYNPEIKMIVSFENRYKFKNARLALKNMENSGENFVIADGFFEKRKEIAEKNIKIIDKIKHALNEKRVVSMYQPIINNITLKIDKFESLIRIKEKEKMLSPYFFLEISKKANLYHLLSVEVLKNSFSVLEETSKEISVNISSMDISVKMIREKIYKYLSTHKDVANRLVLEILEDENIKDEKLIMDFIDTIKSFGVKIAIDDFGSGYSGFERIFKYKPDIIKIDGFLIKNILTDKYAKSLVKAIVNFAKENSIKTVAEFVENEDIFNEVRALGINYSQGYYFSPPKMIGEFNE